MTRGGPSSLFSPLLSPFPSVLLDYMIPPPPPGYPFQTMILDTLSICPVQATTQNEIWSKWDDERLYINKMIKSWWLFTWPSSIGFLVARRSRRTDRVSQRSYRWWWSPPWCLVYLYPLPFVVFDLPGRLIIVDDTREEIVWLLLLSLLCTLARCFVLLGNKWDGFLAVFDSCAHTHTTPRVVPPRRRKIWAPAHPGFSRIALAAAVDFLSLSTCKYNNRFVVIIRISRKNMRFAQQYDTFIFPSAFFDRLRLLSLLASVEA